MKILSMGEIIWDVYPNKKCIGGAPLNFAAHSALLGAEVSLVSAVGNDEFGDSALEYIRNLKISSKYIKKNEYTTGVCDVSVNDRGIPSYSVRKNTSYDNIEITSHDTERINREGFELFYFGTLIQRSDASRRALEKILSECCFPDIICDLNLRPDCYDIKSVSTCLENATILKISDEEEPLLRKLGIYESVDNTPETIARLICARFKQIKVIIITMGAVGAFAYESLSGKSVFLPAEKVTVASTVGAGDSFAAAFAVSYLSGKPTDIALADGIKLSAYVVSRDEAIPF